MKLNIVFWDNEEQEQVCLTYPLTSKVELHGTLLYINSLLISSEVGTLEIFVN